ncbi:uncharacterized protein LOC129758623 [Uranotaenia lowii]|uniref:uncharacterized protein LOC129758619 n=1 Tax=Uranotaenia lowii TaxID=190385 RepID=UPI002478DE8C|nr:uncharacterized protein LOC129758619 [Uranotaenia lowii]XP_055612136.1 uncharacterized protein LOC129758620 [Uranotaenia lowii]XP_055612138.1 uncharacterized protein LOC129758621 [Uranotaenia lowii]XP_055612139.1 uncharacterized protein LOC129758622 [Uranotaenia lowii]XP_055612140.1 uncharacterized protein LOC129758623 [Uranotaenia lowii]
MINTTRSPSVSSTIDSKVGILWLQSSGEAAHRNVLLPLGRHGQGKFDVRSRIGQQGQHLITFESLDANRYAYTDYTTAFTTCPISKDPPAGTRTGLTSKKNSGPSEALKFDYEQTENRNHFEWYPFMIHIDLVILVNLVHSGQKGIGLTSDRHPIYYIWDELILPYLTLDMEWAKQNLASHACIRALNLFWKNDTPVVHNCQYPGPTSTIQKCCRSSDSKCRKNQVTFILISPEWYLIQL